MKTSFICCKLTTPLTFLLFVTLTLLVSFTSCAGLVFYYENTPPPGVLFGGVSNEARQEETTTTDDPINHVNLTLDTSNGLNVYWKTAQANLKRYFEYYNDTSEFKSRRDDENFCAHYVSDRKLDALSEVNGMWAACQDPGLPPECATVSPNAPCSPFIKFGNRQLHDPKLRTIKITFAVEELAILRLTVKGSCIDYAKRKDPFSPCEFNELKEEETIEGWHLVRFSFYPDENGVFSAFILQLIARFQNDVILIDKVETTEYQLCEVNEVEVNCPTQPTTPLPTFTTTTSTTIASTTDDVTMPTDEDETTITSTSTDAIVSTSAVSSSSTRTSPISSTDVRTTSSSMSTSQDVFPSSSSATASTGKESTPQFTSTTEPNSASKLSFTTTYALLIIILLGSEANL